MTIRDDLRVNRGQLKGQVVVLLYRLAHTVRQPLDRRPRLWAIPVGVFYRFFVEWLLGVEIPWKTRIGARLRVYHGVGIVINDAAVLGDDVAIRHGVTIGNKHDGGPCPRIGDGVEIGAGATIIGGVVVGEYAKVGAGCVLTKDLPPGATALGNPAHIRLRGHDEGL